MDWLPRIDGHEGPLYRAIADALARDIAGGRLQPGERLPPQRDLAARLGVDLTTVTRALSEAAAGGLVVSEGRRGTFVRGRPGSTTAEPPGQEAASGMNMPPEPEGGVFRQRYCEGVAALLKGAQAPLHYQPVGGTEAQRRSAASFLDQLVPDTIEDQCLVTAGSQNALSAVLALVAGHGRRVACGASAYTGFLAAARRLGIELVPIEMDEGGICPEAVARAAAQAPIAALYVVPTNDNPTTATLPLDRREALARLARRLDFAIIEDDAYGRLPSKPLAPIAALAPERTWHFVTMSKLLSPSLRVAFVRAPGMAEALALAAAAHETAGMAPPINAALVVRWLDDGSFHRLLAGVRAEAEARMAEAARLLGPLGARFDPEGYHLWLPLEPGMGAERIAAQAVALGLPAVPGSAFAAVSDGSTEALRINLGGSTSRPRLRRELERLAAWLGAGAGLPRPIV